MNKNVNKNLKKKLFNNQTQKNRISIKLKFF